MHSQAEKTLDLNVYLVSIGHELSSLIPRNWPDAASSVSRSC